MAKYLENALEGLPNGSFVMCVKFSIDDQQANRNFKEDKRYEVRNQKITDEHGNRCSFSWSKFERVDDTETELEGNVVILLDKCNVSLQQKINDAIDKGYQRDGDLLRVETGCIQKMIKTEYLNELEKNRIGGLR